MRCLYLCALLMGVLCMCHTPRYGSVNADTVQEALSAPQMALTPRIPGWLLAPRQVYRLSAEQMEQLRAVLLVDKVRQVHEDFYRSEAQGNRNDDSTQVFYLYANNGQCLGGRIVDGAVLMDDFDLTPQENKALYALLLPQLRQIFPDLAS